VALSNCSSTSLVWHRPGGVSPGLTACFKRFAEEAAAGRDPYSLIDPVLESGVRRRPIEAGYGSKSIFQVPWHATLNLSALPAGASHASWRFNTAEWLVPNGYSQEKGEARLVFVHGGNAADSASGPYYAGFTMRLANWTRLPVLAFDYTTEPVSPWPNNLRSVLSYLEYGWTHGPEGAADASKLILVADSEGTLVLMQTLIAMHDDTLSRLLGYRSVLPPPHQLVGGVVLSSAVVDVHCRTRSFDWNCYNFSNPLSYTPQGTGDPDTGNCTGLGTRAAKVDDCLGSYLTYFFGFEGALRGAPHGGQRGAATAEVRRRADFFNQSLLSPIDYPMAGFPPLLVISGTRDYFYSDGPSLAQRACDAGVDAEVFNVHGAFHDFIEYSEGCGSGVPADEALAAYSRIATFTTRVLRRR